MKFWIKKRIWTSFLNWLCYNIQNMNRKICRVFNYLRNRVNTCILKNPSKKLKIALDGQCWLYLASCCRLAGLCCWPCTFFCYNTALYILSVLLGWVVALRIYGMHMNAAYKFSWMILILAFPILGLSLYLFFGSQLSNAIMRKRFREVNMELDPHLKQNVSIIEELLAAGQSHSQSSILYPA